ISEGASSRGHRIGNAAPRVQRNIRKMAVAEIAIQKFALRISRLCLELLNLGIHVPIADQNVRPAIVIEIQESATPPEKLRVRAQARGESCVFKVAATQIVVKRWRISRKVRLHQIEVSVEVVVGG